jgi:predicted membrane-bound spermidine synthase
VTTLQKEARIPGRIVISWTMSGGILFGMIGTVLTLTQQLPGFDFFVTLSSTFVFGALIGMLHGLVLGVFSKPRDTSFIDSFKQVGLGLLYSLFSLPVAYLVTLWIGFAFYYQLDPNFSRLLGAIIGGWIGLSVLVWTAWETWRAIRIIVTAWPDFVLVTGVVAVVFLVLVWFFEAFAPFVFQDDYNIRQAIFISGGIAALVVGPLVTLAAVGLRRFVRLQKIIERLESSPQD